ncbi:MAG: LysR family transcriptional regulator [Burkholderiaceae bacterium]|nr:LysR family transcriptional regulator [Burkholderiaceae bacterium]
MAALPSLRQLRYLTALADTLNFTRAAEACFVSQSTLSAGLKELESTLGLQLVERDRQNVAFTPAGEGVLARARELLSSAEDLVALARTSGAPMQGTIRLGVIPTIAPFLLPKLIPAFREKYPQLKFALREDLSASLLDRLRARQLDMAIIALPYETEGLMVRPLFDDEFWLVALKDDPAVRGKRVSLPAKVADRLLLLEEGHCLREHSLQACKRSEIASADSIEATSLLTLIQMVESGMGIGLIPEMAMRAGLLNGSALIGRPLESPAPKRTIALVARPSTPHIREFELIAEGMVTQHRAAGLAVTSALHRRKSART